MIFGLLLLALTGARAAAPAEEDPAAPTPTAEPASGPEPVTPPDPCADQRPDRSAPFALELDRAKQLYRRGCHDPALALLRDLDVRRRLAPVPIDDTIAQRKYLGEVLVVLGRRQEAEDTFKLLLAEHPDAEMGLLQHSPQAITIFETVKANIVRGPGPKPRPEFQRRSAITYLPFGAAHFKAGDPGRGATYASIQVAALGVSIVSYVVFDARYPRGTSAPDETVLADVFRLKATNYAANGVLILSYIVSQVDASLKHLLASARPQVTVSPAGIGIRGRF